MATVTVFMALMTGFVLLAPVAMAAVLMTGGVPMRREVTVSADTGALDEDHAAEGLRAAA